MLLQKQHSQQTIESDRTYDGNKAMAESMVWGEHRAPMIKPRGEADPVVLSTDSWHPSKKL
jgi:hypothetical protein